MLLFDVVVALGCVVDCYCLCGVLLIVVVHRCSLLIVVVVGFRDIVSFVVVCCFAVCIVHWSCLFLSRFIVIACCYYCCWRWCLL